MAAPSYSSFPKQATRRLRQSTTRLKLTGSTSDQLRALCSAFTGAETRCPRCGDRTTVAPPFDLDQFQCPLCATDLHPFVWIEDSLVDLAAMREVLSGIHQDSRVAPKILEFMLAQEDRGPRLEALLHAPTIAAHALVACVRPAERITPWWAILSVLHPGILIGAVLAHASVVRERLREEGEDLLQNSLSRSSFDPTFLPKFVGRLCIDQALQRLDLGNGWPDVLNGGAEAYRALGGYEASRWSLVVDRRNRLDAQKSTQVRSTDFAAAVVQEVAQAAALDDAIVRDRHCVILQRLNGLPMGSPLIKDDDVTIDESLASPRRRYVRVPTYVLETVNLSNGQVQWSCLRSQDHGPLIGIRWTTVNRAAWGRGVHLGANVSTDADAALESKAKAKALAEIEGSVLAKMWASIPQSLKVYLFSTAIVGSLWVAGYIWWDGLAVEVFGRIGVVFILGLTWWAQIANRGNPLPRVLWATGDLDYREQTARRVQDAFDRVAQFWRTFDYSAPASLSAVLAVDRRSDRLDSESGAFAVHCQDRLIQDAVVTVAERHNIDMSEFKEGIQQINNYGVIASSITGPVAAGDGAQATEQKSLIEKVQTAVGTAVKGPERKAAAS